VHILRVDGDRGVAAVRRIRIAAGAAARHLRLALQDVRKVRGVAEGIAGQPDLLPVLRAAGAVGQLQLDRRGQRAAHVRRRNLDVIVVVRAAVVVVVDGDPRRVIAGDNTGISKEVGWKGGGDFIYIQLAKWNEEAKEKIIETKSYEELVKLFSGLYKHYFLNYNVRVKDFEESVIKSDEFKKLSLADQKKMFAKMLDLNQMYVNFSERNDKKYNLSKNDIALSEEFYGKK
jgi:hypothetical protein